MWKMFKDLFKTNGYKLDHKYDWVKFNEVRHKLENKEGKSKEEYTEKTKELAKKVWKIKRLQNRVIFICLN